jgi:hypothetical protein
MERCARETARSAPVDRKSKSTAVFVAPIRTTATRTCARPRRAST